MGITKKVWVTYCDKSKTTLKAPIAIVGSSGLRSVGKIAVDVLIEKLQPRLFAELYSYGFPGVYYGPSYVGAPSNAGTIRAKGNLVELPKVEFYLLEAEKILIIRGYQAYDSLNQYLVADTVTDLFKQFSRKKGVFARCTGNRRRDKMLCNRQGVIGRDVQTRNRENECGAIYWLFWTCSCNRGR